MGRNLRLDVDSPDEDLDAALEELWPYDSVSVKTHTVVTIADAAEQVGVDPTRFRELLGRPADGERDDRHSDSDRPGTTAYTISPDEVADLCAFVRRVTTAIEDAIDVEAAVERRRQVPAGESVQDHFEEDELTLLNAWSSLSSIQKMCAVADEYDLGMKVL